MTPSVFIYEEGRLMLTPECRMLPEVKNIIDKYGEEIALPYLAYAHLITWVNSPFINYDEEDKKDNAMFDVKETIGDFDEDEPLLEPLIEKLTRINSSPLKLLFDGISQEMHRIKKYLDSNEISKEDIDSRTRLLKDTAAIVKSYNSTKTAAEEELKKKARGNAKVGDYFD